MSCCNRAARLDEACPPEVKQVECTGIHEIFMTITLLVNCRNRPVFVRFMKKILRRRDKCRQGEVIARVMLQSGSATRYKRTHRRFELVVECTGVDIQLVTIILVANCRATVYRNHPVVVSCKRNKTYTEIKGVRKHNTWVPRRPAREKKAF